MLARFPLLKHGLALAGAALFLSACGQKPAPQAAAPQGRSVQAPVAVVALAPVPVTTEAPGTVVSDQQVQLSSRVMGYIRRIAVHEGDRVRKGQLLFAVDPSDIQSQVAQARAGLAQAQAGLAGAKINFERSQALLRDESIPRAQFDQARTQYDVAKGQVAAAMAGLRQAQSQFGYAEVHSPIDGVVTQKLSAVGDMAAPGRPILVIENPGALQVRATVGQDTFAGLHRGDAVQVLLEGRPQAVTGHVVRLAPAADPMTHSYTVKVALPPLEGVRSGDYARLRFVKGTQPMLRVPQGAVLDRAGITGVFVVDAQGIAHYRMVRTGAASDGMVAIQAGLNPGERVVVGNNADLESGDRVSGGAAHG